jgi:hypothetical protein
MSDALEARLARLEDLMEIHQLFVDYGRYLDAGDFDAYAELFADDGEVLLGPMGRAKGPAGARGARVAIVARPRRRSPYHQHPRHGLRSTQ